MKKLTPMMAQYLEIKSQYEDAFLFFRLGDFYELFQDDAIEASKLLGITLTRRGKNENAIPMCGVPFHAAEAYLAKLTKLGKKVAICDQVSDPKEPGIVKREVTKVVTPGTTFDDKILDKKSNNFISAITRTDNKLGFSFADVSTGLFEVTEIDDLDVFREIFLKIAPKECICSPDILCEMRELLGQDCYFFPFESFKESYQLLKDHFNIKSLDGFGIQDYTIGIEACALLLHYLQETQKQNLVHIRSIKAYHLGDYMHFDVATVRNLELVRNLREGTKEGSLFWVIDKTLTAMGGRLLISWITHPLLSKDAIEKRLNAVDELFSDSSLLQNVQNSLRDVLDIERLLARLSLASGNARDLLALKQSLQKIPALKDLLNECNSKYLCEISGGLNECDDLAELIENAISEDAPLSLREGKIIKEGFNSELDKIREVATKGKSFILELQAREIKRTGISSLKVKYNKVFGYYIEISKSNLNRVPEDYMRKQTLVNAERFITPELKEYEETVLGAEEKMVAQEYELFCGVRDKVLEKIDVLQMNARLLATLDVLASFALVAIKNKYCKPEIRDDAVIDIKNGRHAVVEQITVAGRFVPNDTFLNTQDDQIHLITGPNMGGKSTYLRQVALTSLMAQIGSFVPADSASLSIVDRIFTRVGASDNLVRGQSTFMVEMQEAANILHNASERSLIILDEIGRGTSTYDGVSIAWAILEYVHDVIGAKTLFATHYHELISVCASLKCSKNYSVHVRENSDEGVVFLYKIAEGGVDKSYGIEVAKLAGLPEWIVNRSKEILHNLEEGQVDKSIQTKIKKDREPINQNQIGLFDGPQISEREHKALEELKSVDVNNITPIEALKRLHEMKKEL